ncbi:MAG: hypothetical protein AB7E73_03530 [Burkholderiales bacterium]
MHHFTCLILLSSLLLPSAPAAALGMNVIATQPVAADGARRKTSTKTMRAPFIVTSTGAGQTGYVHYWTITAPDGAQEMQVGLELPDRRIAWSFPGVGVTVAPFIADGEYDASGQRYKVVHHFGVRPYRNEAAVQRLQSGIRQRLKPWLGTATPYCELNGTTAEVCVSCFGFVAQVLYPGATRQFARFPRDFPFTVSDEYHTTEDLLLYLTGLHALPDAAARRRRMAALGGPIVLQEELARLTANLPDRTPTRVAGVNPVTRKPAVRAAPKPAPRRPSAG